MRPWSYPPGVSPSQVNPCWSERRNCSREVATFKASSDSSAHLSDFDSATLIHAVSFCSDLNYQTFINNDLDTALTIAFF